MKTKASFLRIIAFLTILQFHSCLAPTALANNMMQRAADQILHHQTSDGALAMSAVSASPSDVVPYFSNLSAIGLIHAYRITHRVDLIICVMKWVKWYEVHINADGTIFDYHGSPGKWQSTGTYDSVDSYAATYLELVWGVYQSNHDLAWLKARKNSVHRVLGAIRSVLQPNGLTIAKPTYPVMYTMDNVETLRGLQSAVQIENLLGDRNETAKISAWASAMLNAISVELWDIGLQCYRVDIQTDGGKEEGLGKWYPNIMANLMAIAWMPSSSINRDLLNKLNDRFGRELPSSIRNNDDLDHFIWWGMAAHGAGDRALLDRIKRVLSVSMPTVLLLDNLANMGHICRL